MPKKIKVVDVNASVSVPVEVNVVSVEADPVVGIPNEEQPVQVVEEVSPPAEPSEPEATAEPVAGAEPKKKRAPRARSAKPKKRKPVEVMEEVCLNQRGPSWRLFRLPLLFPIISEET